MKRAWFFPRSLLLLWAFTGLFSLVLNATTPSEATRAWQNLALLLGVLGTLAWALRALGLRSARELILALAPALGAVLLGLFVLPAGLLPLLGAALGWLVVVALWLRGQVPAEQRAAIRLWRRGKLAAAVSLLDERIRAHHDEVSSRLLRARILLAWGKAAQAARAAEWVCARQTTDAAAHNFLAEARLQAGELAAARRAAERASALAPSDWVAAYNLGMIAERQEDAVTTIAELRRALGLRMRERRHRALAWLWLARAWCRQGESAAAEESLAALRAESSAIHEWAQLLRAEAAAPLRALVAADVALAERLLAGEEGIEALGCGA